MFEVALSRPFYLSLVRVYTFFWFKFRGFLMRLNNYSNLFNGLRKGKKNPPTG